jgi:hypothetical protein
LSALRHLCIWEIFFSKWQQRSECGRCRLIEAERMFAGSNVIPRSIPTTRHDNPRLAQDHPPDPVDLVDVGTVQLRRPEIIDLQLEILQRLPIRLAEVSLSA